MDTCRVWEILLLKFHHVPSSNWKVLNLFWMIEVSQSPNERVSGLSDYPFSIKVNLPHRGRGQQYFGKISSQPDKSILLELSRDLSISISLSFWIYRCFSDLSGKYRWFWKLSISISLSKVCNLDKTYDNLEKYILPLQVLQSYSIEEGAIERPIRAIIWFIQIQYAIWANMYMWKCWQNYFIFVNLTIIFES